MSRETLRARVAVADPAPWRYAEDEDGYYTVGFTGDGVDSPIFGYVGTMPGESDAAFIAHARQDIPALLAVADAAEAFLDGYEETLPTTLATPAPLYAVRERLRAALDAVEALP